MSLDTYNKLKHPPQDAIKPITGGRLKGKYNIDPQWRYEIMTEVFGVIGIGWKYTIDNKWTEQGSDGQVAAFADISVYIYNKDRWSEPIPANGGSMFIEKERSGLHTNDECYKMAITDALGNAMKMLGVGADVFRGVFDNKYEKGNSSGSKASAKTNQPEKDWLNPKKNNEDSKEWIQVVNRLKKKTATIEDIKKHFKISKANEAKLLEIINNAA